ncbi:MAG TPA: LPXTG cell wall anchor domain-containing protein [Pseudogracilibacillus sp.]|nr:LPXTG cell wall anchor domain-containing protein [Pseudogracilibacillus sp.]
MNINKGGFEKNFLISVLITFIGILLPWVDSIKGNISGIENFYGVFILILLLVSLGIFYFTRRKKKLVSISLVIIGILSFLLVMRTFTELGYAINPLTGIFVDYGIGVYITALGSIGIAIVGTVGLKGKK